MSQRIIFLLIAIAGLVLAWQARHSAGDDAFITLRVVQNALTGNGLHYNLGEVGVQVCTSPLNLILSLLFSAALTLVGVGVSDACQLAPFLIAIFAIPLLALGIIRLISDENSSGIWGASLALLGSLVLSTIGLETILLMAFCVWSLVFLRNEKYFPMGFCLGLAFLARHDALILVLLVLIYLLISKKPSGGIVPVLGPIILTIGPWLAFSAVYFGQTVPTTLKSKLAQGGSIYWPEPYYTGFWKSWVSNCWDSVPLAITVCSVGMIGLFVAVKKKNIPILILAGFGMIHLLAYSLLRLPQYHWYFVPYFVIVCVLAGLTISNAVAKFGSIPNWVACALLFVGVVVIRPNSDPRFQAYKQVGEYLNQNPPMNAVGLMEIGIIGFFAPKAKVFDFSGLATLSQIDPVREGRAAKWLDDPSGVDKVVIRGEMHPMEPDIRGSFKDKYELEKSFDPTPQFKNGLQVWRLR